VEVGSEAVGLRGRKYFGAFDTSGEYFVCVQLVTPGSA